VILVLLAPVAAMGEVGCPVGECDYSGAPESVEAHISGSTGGGHSGALGSEYREELRSGSPVGLEGSAGSGGGQAEPAASAAVGVSAGIPLLLDEDGPSALVMVAAATVVVVVLYLLLREPAGSSSGPVAEEER
jgi:hypothetical protein